MRVSELRKICVEALVENRDADVFIYRGNALLTVVETVAIDNDGDVVIELPE